MLEGDYEFSCPNCGTDLSLRLDPTAGKRQSFVQDCEICCRPIHITIVFEGDEVLDFQAEPEE